MPSSDEETAAVQRAEFAKQDVENRMKLEECTERRRAAREAAQKALKAETETAAEEATEKPIHGRGGRCVGRAVG